MPSTFPRFKSFCRSRFIASSAPALLPALSALVAATVLGAVTGTNAVHAQVELLTNGGFDNQIYNLNNYSWIATNVPTAGAANVNTGPLPNVSGVLPGWTTTIYNPNTNTHVAEIWNGNFVVPSQSPGAYNGTQFAELNSGGAGSLLQTITNIAPGNTLFLSFAHSDRGGDSFSSTLRVTLFNLGADGIFSSSLATPSSTNPILGGDDSFLVNQIIGPVTYNDSANPLKSNWTFYNFQTSALTSNNMLLAFQTISSTGDPGIGNFIDAVSLNTVSPTAAPEPGSLALLLPAMGAIGAIGLGIRKQRQK